jgi:hypothetical protein
VLFALLSFALLGVVFASCPALAATQNGTVNVSGVVSGPPPATPPIIDSPADAVTSTQKNITASGTCQPGLIVKLFRTGVFAGSVACQADSRYTLNLDLIDGRNDLIARQYDALDQSSPDSDTITVYFVPPAEQPVITTPAGGAQVASFQLVIDYNYNFQGMTVGNPVHLPLHFIGGCGPYAVSVSWNDGNVSLMSRETAEQFFVDHVYSASGTYSIKVRISDGCGNVAYLQFAMTVNGVTPQAVFLGIPLNNVLQHGLLPAITWPTLTFSTVTFAFGVIVSRLWPRISGFLARLFLKKY